MIDVLTSRQEHGHVTTPLPRLVYVMCRLRLSVSQSDLAALGQMLQLDKPKGLGAKVAMSAMCWRRNYNARSFATVSR